MKAKNILPLVLLIGGITGLSSCVSTEIIEPESDVKETDELILNLSAPADVSTRASEGYKLRYIAKIFRGNSSNTFGEPLQRKEIIDGEVADNKIVFKVDPNYNYTLMVFADYIPSTTQANSQGLYADYFYNTSQYPKASMIRTTPGKDSETVSADFFNNDNYDSFFGRHTLYKDEKEVIVNMTLKRTTAKVIFRETSSNTGEGQVKVTNLKYGNIFQWDVEDAGVNQYPSLNLSLGTSSTISDEDKDLFYFYTLADSNTTGLALNFTFTITGGDPLTYTIPNIPVTANHRTIVKGAFLPDPQSEPDPLEGDIILNLSTDYTWEQESIEK